MRSTCSLCRYKPHITLQIKLNSGEYALKKNIINNVIFPFILTRSCIEIILVDFVVVGAHLYGVSSQTNVFLDAVTLRNDTGVMKNK